MNIIVTFKKGNPITLTDVTKVKTGHKLVDSTYTGDEIKTMTFPSDKDILIQHAAGSFSIAANTYEYISVEF